MELEKIFSFSGKTQELFNYIFEIIFYKKSFSARRKIIKKIKKIFLIVLKKNQVKLIINGLPNIKDKLNEDALFLYKNDPSLHSLEEGILTSNGLYAIMVYRVSNFLFKNNIEIIPRLLSSYAHSKTGIDINPEAEIGRSFFIDHGTGIVIGATAYIGNNVKLYHGVTLGTKSFKSIESLKKIKRHPTILNDVTIYSNSTILGGDTIIGEGSIIGCNKIITESVQSNTKII